MRLPEKQKTVLEQGGKGGGGGGSQSRIGPIFLQITNHVCFSECFTNYVLNLFL